MATPHIFVAVQELGIHIGDFPTVRREIIVDVGNAKSFADAETKAKQRVAKKFKTNVVCLQVTEVRSE
jgi:hypothetical protein